MTTLEQQDSRAIRPFTVRFRAEALDDLRRRLRATRWPTPELVRDREQGVQLATMRALGRYWAKDYDVRRVQSRLNALPQFTTEIDGVDIHFVHVRSKHPDALPLVMTHGWPGSIIEMIDSIGPLTDPTAHGGTAADAFHLVLPSLPGYGFSAEPTELGWDLVRTAQAWAELMRRLGYDRYVAQGGDVGAGVTDALGRLGPQGLAGIHTNLLVTALNDPASLPNDTEEERAALAAIKVFQTSGNGYFVEMATRPETIGYALLDSPSALAAWMIDHDTDAYDKIAGAFVDDKPTGNLTRDHILDNVTAYWLTGTGASSARSYWEAYGPDASAAGRPPLPDPRVPVGFSTFPGEIWRTPRSWAEQAYPTLNYFGVAARGGHFAAWEEPELFAAQVRAAFRPLR
ncbi:epoxide hydrolase family protein [Kribbella sp. CA-293567]|uniref:epoxide hydrolase family protein n=1 Tax=Kribbella sp. CA-293567 TaxID=3002436 RepID=UPI0022DDAFCE|nr:epoxide hydrolase family protein [Kribbella sp. CA-293567]WBQ08448.1 epoxide hydrolase [Kribbella sp. CA-293567]